MKLWVACLQNAVKTAIEAGYRHIDTAWAYKNEAEIGAILKGLFDAGVVKREELFITSKVTKPLTLLSWYCEK